MMVMSGRKAVRLVATALALALVPLFMFPTATEPRCARTATTFAQPAPWDPSAPYVDNVIYKVIADENGRVAALWSGDIDYLPQLFVESGVNIWPPFQVTQVEVFGYECLAINCGRYPLSILGFRRALALATDKLEIAAIISMEQGAAYPLDSPLPPCCGAWFNNNTYPRYGKADVNAAKAELAAAGFLDIDGDGSVEAPDGTDFAFRLLYDPAGYWIVNASRSYWGQAGIPVQPEPDTTSGILDKLFTVPRDYDGALLHFAMDPSGPSPLSLVTWTSDQIANPEGNFLNWANASYDDTIDTMLTTADYETVLAAAHAAQQVFVQDAPMIPLYGSYKVTAHRMDRFEGWVVSTAFSTSYENLWVPRKVRLRAEQPERDPISGCGGTLYSAIAADVNSNPLGATSLYSRYVLGQIYDSLTGLNDPRSEQPTKTGGGLAYDWTITELPTQLQLDFILYGNATWHDGTPVTPDDVAFSYNYIRNHAVPAYTAVLSYLNSCVALDGYRVRIISNGKSYWAFENLRNWVILPKHLWEGVVSPETFTNPEPIGSGPFRWFRHVAGEYVELRFWELYHQGFLDHPEYWPTSTPTPNWIVLGVCIIVLTLVASILYLRVPRRQPRPNH